MRKLVTLYIACAVLLTACIETLTSTDIKADGSGSMTATVDLSEIMKMMAEGKTNGGELKIDTTMFMRDHADTSPLLSAYQKKLVHDMKMRMIMNLSAAEEFKFIMTITVPFKSLDDFNALNELMKQDEYDKVFDKAMEIPMFSDKNNEEEKGAGGNDNPFGSLFPSFYNCIQKKLH